MIRSRIGRSVGVGFGFGLGLICSACGGTSSTPNPTKPDGASVCDPGARRCDGDLLKRCDQSGASETVEMTCPTGRCLTQGDQASCNPSPPLSVCSPNATMCDGNIVTKCKADGSGLQQLRVDCSTTNQYCIQGTCHDTQCIAGTKSCKDGDVYLCANDGSSLALADDCTEHERCDADSGSCLPRVCEPNKVTCSSTQLLTCNDKGSDWLPITVDCAKQGKVCSAGSCQDKACTPSSTFCREGDLYQCDPNGASSALSKTCRKGFEHCEVTPAGLYAYCVPDACTAGQKLCAGEVIKTCNPDGSLPADGIACGKNEYCEQAMCKPLDCNLNTLFCKENNVYGCQPGGSTLYWECDPTQACLAIVPDGDSDHQDLTSCMPLSCPPGGTGCVLNKIGTCGTDGATLSTVTTDCAASSKVCTTSGTCAASVTDTLGKAEFSEALQGEPYVGNVIDVKSARKLTELQMWLVFPAPRDLRWIVFEQVGSDFIPRAEKITTLASSAGFASSGPLSFSYQLEVGKRYALGVVIPTNSVDSITSQIPLPAAESASFGTVRGSVRAFSDFSTLNITDSFVAYTVSYMKVTTESP